MNPAVLVLTAGLEQQDLGRRVFAEPRCHRTAGRSRADHDKIGLDPFRRILLRRHSVISRLSAPAGGTLATGT